MTRGRPPLAAVLASSAFLVTLIAFAGCKRLSGGAGTGPAPLPSGALPVAATALPTALPLPAPLPGARAPQSYSDLAAKADPAVVFVTTRQ